MIFQLLVLLSWCWKTVVYCIINSFIHCHPRWFLTLLSSYCTLFAFANYGKSSQKSQIHVSVENEAIRPICWSIGWKRLPEISRKIEKKCTIGFDALFSIFTVSQLVIQRDQMKAWIIILSLRYVSIFLAMNFYAYYGNYSQLFWKSQFTTTPTKFRPFISHCCFMSQFVDSFTFYSGHAMPTSWLRFSPNFMRIGREIWRQCAIKVKK